MDAATRVAGLRKGRAARFAPLLANPRFEVFPAKSTADAVAEAIRPGMTVTVTASPAKGLDATLELTERLAGLGYRTVPHISARLVTGEAHLAGIVERLLACGVEDVFVPAGDADPPAGPFHGALDLLEQLTKMGSPFPQVGITGYPERHPRIHDDVTVQAMWDKRRHATYIVSNLCFDPAVLRRWINRIRARGVTLPVYLGLAGPVEKTKLVKFAARAGVAESARVLTSHTDWLLRLGTPGGYSPERLLAKLGDSLTSPESAVVGLHLFTFNQLRETEQWRRRMIGQAPASAR